MFGYLPQAILIALVIYDMVQTYRQRAQMRRVGFPETVVGWAAILLLLIWGGFFR
jgi:hypothetical protein